MTASPPSRLLLAAFVLVVIAGCARRPAPLPRPIPMEPAEVRRLVGELARKADSVRRYQGFVRVRGRGPEGSFEAKLVVIFERPSHLRVELLGAFGGTRWSAVATGEEITAYFPGREQYVREPDVADVVGRLLGLRLTTAEVIAILSGAGVPLDAETEAEAYRRGESVFLELASEEGTSLVQVDPDGQIVSARTADYEVSYPTSWMNRARQIPDRLGLENPSIRATLTAEDVDVNVSVDPAAFALEIPREAERLRPAEVEGEAVFVIERKPGGPER